MLGVIIQTAVALAQTPGRVVDVALEGDPLPDAAAVLDRQLGRLASPDALVELVRALEALPDAGTIEVHTHEADGRARLTVRHTAGPMYVGRLAVRLDAQSLSPTQSRALLRRVAVGAALNVRGGRRFHPALLSTDRAALTRWYAARGYRDVNIQAVLAPRGDLIDVGWQIARGDRYEYTAPQLSGVPRPARQAALSALTIHAGAAARPTDVIAQRDRLRAVLCAQGYPRAQVDTREHIGPASAGVRLVQMHIDVNPGPRIRTGAVQVAGRFVPQIFMTTLPLREGAPYCPALEDAARARLTEYLSNAGVPNPQITVHRRTRLRPDGRRVLAVTFDVRRLVDARITQIWFVGNRVTHPAVLRQLTAIREGERYQQSRVDESVQAMRRSGLFRRVSVDVIEGQRADRVSVRFRVIERVPFRVVPAARAVTLYNMDLFDWPDDRVDLAEGFAFRGAGQRLDLFGQSDALGFRWFNAFLGRYLLGLVSFQRAKATSPAFAETWTTIAGGLGLKTATNSLNAVLVNEWTWHSTTPTDGFAVEALNGEALTAALAIQLAFDQARRDDERIRYLGVDGRAQVRFATAVTGEPIRWVDTETQLTLHLPLWETRRGQHWVIRLGVSNRSVISLGDADLPGHVRKRPVARGYAPGGLGVRVQGPDADAVIGALYSSNATLELRIPLPWGRRNGVSPFLDTAAAADDADALPDDLRVALGLAISFSLFQERIEGIIWGAWPLAADVEAQYIGGGFGGSF